MRNVRKCIGGAVLFVLLFPVLVYAQVPSYAQSSNASDEETIHGRVASLSGQFDLAVRDDRGFIDHIQLHPGTILNPTGLTLSPGMSVTILGYNRGKIFAANEIDTPYTSSYNYAPAYAPVYSYGDNPYLENWNTGYVYGGYGSWGYGGWYGARGYGGWHDGGYARGGGWDGHGDNYGRGGGGDGHGGGSRHGGGGLRR